MNVRTIGAGVCLRHSTLAMAVAVVGLVWGAGSMAAARGDDLTSLVPADALAVVTWSGVTAQAEAFADSRLARLVDATELPEAWDRLRAMATKAALEDPSMDPEDRELFTRVLDNAHGIGKRQVAVWVMPPGDQPGRPRPGVGLLIGATPEDAEGARLRETIAQIVELAEDADAEPPEVSRVGDGATLVAWNADANGLLADDPESSWAQRESWGRRAAAMSGPAALSVGLNTQALLGWAGQRYEAQRRGGGMPPDAPTWTELSDALGAPALGDVVWANGFGDDGGWVSALRVDMPGPRSGLPGLLDSAAIDPAAWQRIPANVDAAWLVSIRPESLLELIRTLADDLAPEQGRAQVDQVLAMAGGMSGINIEEGLLKSLGPSWAAYLDPVATGQGLGGLIIVNPLRVPDGAAQTAERLAQVANLLIQMQMPENTAGDPTIRVLTTTWRGVRLHRAGLPFVSPTWAVHRDALYLGPQPETVVGAVQRQESGVSEPLDPEAAKVSSVVPDGARLIYASYLNLPSTASQSHTSNVALMRLFTGMGEMFSGEPVPPLIPTYWDVRPELAPAWQLLWVDEQGLHGQSWRPFPGSQMYAPRLGTGTQMAAMQVGILLPALGAARRTARQMQASTQGRAIFQAMFADAMDDPAAIGGARALTDDLGELIGGGGLPPDYVISPTSNTAIPPDLLDWPAGRRSAWVRQHSDFIVITGLTDSLDSERVAVFLDPACFDFTGTSVVYADGAAEWVPDIAWLDQTLIDQTGMTVQQHIERYRAGR